MESKHSQFIPCCANTVCINRRKILKKRSTNNKIWPFACDHRLKLRKPWAHTLQSVCSLWRRRQRIRHEHAIGYLRLRVFIYLSSWFKLQQRTLSPFMAWYTCMPINNTAYTQVHGALTSPHYTTHIQTEMSQVNILCKIHRHTLKGTRKKSCREKQQGKVKLERKRRRKWKKANHQEKNDELKKTEKEKEKEKNWMLVEE